MGTDRSTMPFHRRKRRRRRRRTSHKTAGQAYELAKKAYRLTDHESLNDDQRLSEFIPLIATFNQILMNGLTRASGPDNYQGRKYFMTSLNFSGIVNRDPLAPGSQVDLVRLMVVYDKVPNGIAFVADDLLIAGSVGSGDTFIQASAPRNLSELKRFTVLWDHKLELDFFKPAFKINRTIRIMKSTVTDGNTGLIADIQVGSLFLLLISSAAATVPTLSMTTRLRFRP